MHGRGRERGAEEQRDAPASTSAFFNVWDPGEHPPKRQQPEGGAAGGHERRPELDAGGRRAGRKHGRTEVSAARMETCVYQPPPCSNAP